MTALDIAAIQLSLKARLRDLQARVAHIETDLSAEHSPDFADQATEREQDDALQGEDAVLMHQIRLIRSALGRIEQDLYGECASCGQEIAENRLLAMPETSLCFACANAAQRA